MAQKEIQIVEAKDSAPKDLPELDQADTFARELTINGIQDLDDPNLVIKKDGLRYIFAIKGKDTFSVTGQSVFEQRIKDFYDKQKAENVGVYLEANHLKLEILANAGLVNESPESNGDIELDVGDFQRRLATYKEFFKAQKNESARKAFWLNANNAGKEKAAYKMTAKEAEVQLKRIEAIEQRLNELLNPKRYKEAVLANYERDASMKQLSQELDNICEKIPQFVAYRNDILMGNADTVPYFHITINSIDDARKTSQILKNFNKQELKLDQYAADAATQQKYAQILQSLESYFEDATNNATFTPYEFSPEQLMAINYFPKLKTAMEDMAPKTERTANKKNTSSDVVSTDVQQSFDNKTAEAPVVYKDRKEAFAKGGINGLTSFGLDQTKMSPQQKETWKGLGNLAVTGGLVFLGWKFLSTGFKALTKKGREGLDKDGGRGWLWMPVAGTFASNMFLGESPLALLSGGKGTEYISKLFGGKTGEKSALAETYTTGVTGACALFEGRTCAQVAETVETDSNGKMKLKPSFYNDVISAAKGVPSDSKKLAAAQFLEKIGKDDPNNLINTTLAAIGLSEGVLRDSKNANEQFNEKAAGAIARLASVTAYMEKNHFDRINKDQMSLIQDYIANKDGKMDDLDDLQKRRGDLFEDSLRAPDEATKEQWKLSVDKLSIGDTEKQELLLALYNFWKERPLSKDLKKLDITQNGKYVDISTYGQTTKLDIAGKTIPGLEDINKVAIRFQSTFELIKVANLTNRILDLTKTNPNVIKKDPFNISRIGGDIEYDNTAFWTTPVERFNHMDKEVASGGFNGALGKISPVLEENKQGYVALLNARYNKIHNLN